MQQLEEKRKLKRYLIRLKVIDRETGALLGFAEDIHMGGMKVMSKQPIPAQQELKVWLGKEDTHLKIPITIFRIWSSFMDTDPVVYYAGVHFINLTDAAMDSIQTLIDTEEGKPF